MCWARSSSMPLVTTSRKLHPARAPRRLPLIGAGNDHRALSQETPDESFSTRDDSGCGAGGVRWPHTADASLSVSGRIIGPFRYEFVRKDDPNDLIPHDRRRDLRGLEVLFAWLNHTNAKGDNSLDPVDGKGPDARIVHHLLDFGDSFGSDSDIAKDPRHGQEFWLPTSPEQVNRAMTLGLVPTSWEKRKYPGQLPA